MDGRDFGYGAAGADVEVLQESVAQKKTVAALFGKSPKKTDEQQVNMNSHVEQFRLKLLNSIDRRPAK